MIPRRALFAAAVCAAALKARHVLELDSQYGPNVIGMNNAWNAFFRKWAGCPKEAREVEECRPIAGSSDVKLFDRARTAAKRLFKVKDA